MRKLSVLTSFWGGILAVCKARILRRGFLYLHIADMADNLKVTLSVPAFSVISGGSHTGNKLATQEFLILSFLVEQTSGKPCALELRFTTTWRISSKRNMGKMRSMWEAKANLFLGNKEALELLNEIRTAGIPMSYHWHDLIKPLSFSGQGSMTWMSSLPVVSAGTPTWPIVRPL